MFRGMFGRKRKESDFKSEIESHIQLETERLVEQGLSPADARAAARRAFGNVTKAQERFYEAGRWLWWDRLWQDIRYGLRQLRRNPGFTIVAALTLALGIGANTAIFSLVNAVLLRSLPVRNPARLVLFSDNPKESLSMSGGIPSGRQTLFSYPFYRYVRDNSRLFRGICAFQTPEDTLTVREEGRAGAAVQVAQGKMVSGDYFSVLGVRAIWGRALTPADDRPEAPPAAVISFNYWKRRLAGDPAIVGKTFEIDGVPLTIVGVAPRGFYGVRMTAGSADFWMPLALRPRMPLTAMPQAKGLLTDPHFYWLNMMGRLKPGVTIRQARAEINTELRRYLTGQAGSRIAKANRQRIERAYVPLAPGGRGLSQLRYQYAEPLRILLVVVGLVLLIACANVANLMLDRATARRKEMAMRLALGETRTRLARQILIECALIAAAGAGAGAIFAWWSLQVLVAMVAAKVPLDVRPDLAVLAFTAGVSVLAVILSGMAPALRAARVDLVPTLKAGEAAGGGERTRWGFGKGLVVFQVAVSLVLMVGAGLLVHSLIDLENQNLGFDPEHVLLVNVDTELAGYKSSELPGLYRTLVNRINALPGVRSASIGSESPMSGNWGGFPVSVEGEPPPAGGGAPQVVVVGPHYFGTERMPVLAGRPISGEDTAAAAPVAVVNQAFVRRYIPVGNALGRRVSYGVPFTPPGNQIVGVVKDARFSSAREPAGPMFFLSVFQLQSVMASVNEIEVRAAGDPASLAGEVREAIHQIAPDLPVTDVTTLSVQVNRSLGRQRAVSSLTGFFGVLGLVLACVGLYGIMAYSVARRTHEMGIRMALGAENGDIMRMVVGQGLRLVIVGLAVGVLAALGVTRFLSSLLYGVRPTDPLTFAVVSLLFTTVGFLASYLPARRAMRVDPVTALKHE